MEYYKAGKMQEMCIHTTTWLHLNHMMSQKIKFQVDLYLCLYLCPHLYLHLCRTKLLRLISCVNLARLRYSDIWLNIILDVSVEVFSR